MTRRSKLVAGALCAAAVLLGARTAIAEPLMAVAQDKHLPLRVEIGWCSAMGAADVYDTRGVWATWGASPSSRTMQVHYSWVRMRGAMLPRLLRLRACRLGQDGLECQTIYDRRPGHPAVGHAPQWNEVEERGQSTANQQAEIHVDWGDRRRKGDVLFLRVNDESVERSLKRGGFCPIPYPLYQPMASQRARFRWYGVEPDATNGHVSAAGLDLCRDGSRLSSEAGESACISSVGWGHMREMVERVDRGQLRYMLGDEPLVPRTTYHGPEGLCPTGAFCGTRVFFQRIPHGAAFSAPGFLWFPTSSTDVAPEYDNGFAGSPNPFRFTSPAAHLVHYAAHELFHSLQYAWCRSGLTAGMTADEHCIFKDHPAFDRPPFVVDPWLQGSADGWWTCLDGYVDGDPNNPNVPCGSATRISHQQNLAGLGEYNGWLAEPSRDLLRWRPNGSEPAYLFWSYVGEQFATARAPTNLSHPLRLPGSAEETTASRLQLDPSDYARPLGDARRRPDEGADIRARVAEHFQDHYDEPVIDVLDGALVRHLGRTLRNVVVDLHTAMVLKDYVRVSDDPHEYWRWHLDWLGSHTAGATQEFFPQNPGVGVPSLEQIKQQQAPPFEGMLPVPVSLSGRSPLDYTRRAYRARDSWTGMICPCPADAAPEPKWFAYGESESSPESLHLEPFGMAVVSVAPAPRPAEPWLLRIRASRGHRFATQNRDFDMRVFTVSAGKNAAVGGPRAGQPALIPSCTFSPDERALRAPGPIDVCRLRTFPASHSWVGSGYDESVFIGAGDDNDVREVIAIFSASDRGADVSWTLSSGSYQIAEVRHPSQSSPARIARYLGQADASAGPVRFEARFVDDEGDPVAIDPSVVALRLPGCEAWGARADAEGCTLRGTDARVQWMSTADGWLRALVSLPGEWLPPPGPAATDLDLEVEVGGTSVVSMQRAVRVVDREPRTALALVVDEHALASDALALETQSTESHAVRLATELALRSLGPDDAVGVVSYGRRARRLFELRSLCEPNVDVRADALAQLADPEEPASEGPGSLSAGLLEAESMLAEALDEPIETTSDDDPLISCRPERQALVVVGAGQGEEQAHQERSAQRSPALRTVAAGAEPSLTASPDGSADDPRASYAPAPRYRERIEAGLPVPAVAAVAIGPDAPIAELHTLVRASAGAGALVASGMTLDRGRDSAFDRRAALALELADSTRQALGSVTGHERAASWTLELGTVRTLPSLIVEDGADELLVSLVAPVAPVAGIVLRSAEDELIAPETASDHVAVFRVPWPAPGTWTWQPDRGTSHEGPLGPVFIEQAVRARVKLDVTVEVAAEGPPAPFDAASSGIVSYSGSELIVHTLVADGLPIAGARVVATITMPSGREVALTLTDDGETEDGRAGDGHYATVLWDTFEPGTYRVRVRAFAELDESAPPLTRERLLAVTFAEGPDTDDDGLPDWWEQRYSPDPGGIDPALDDDHDGLSNAAELELHTSPRAADSDGGGEADGSELLRGADPLDAGDDVAVRFDVAVTAANGSALVSGAAPPSIGAVIEIERGPTAAGPFEAVWGVPDEEGIVRDSVPNDETWCYRSRTRARGVMSDWSAAACVTAREDPSAPTVSLALEGLPPRPGDTEIAVRIDATDAPGPRAGHDQRPVHTARPAPAAPSTITSGVADVLLSLDPNFSDALWEPYAPTVLVPLVDPTFTALYAKVRDRAGNESETASIVLYVDEPRSKRCPSPKWACRTGLAKR